MEKENKIALISTIVLIGFFLAVVYHYFLSYYMGLKAPFDSFVFPSYKAFCDFFEILPLIRDFSPYSETSIWIAYFPLSYILLYPFSLIKNPMLAYSIFAGGFLSFLAYVNTKILYSKAFSKLQNFQNIFIFTFLTYPVLYNLDKGNFDMFLFVVLALFVYFFKKEKYMAAAVLLAVENAIKPSAVLFLLLLLFKKKYKEFFVSIFLTAFFVIGGFLALKGGFFDQISVYIKNLAPFKLVYVYNDSNNLGLMFTSSIFMPLKWLFCQVSSNPLMTTHEFDKIYSIVSNILSVAMIYFIWREKSFWKQIMLLTLNMLVFPYLIYDYKLIFLFIPLLLFINAKEKTKFDTVYTVLFSLFLIPKNIIFINSAALSDHSLLDFYMGVNEATNFHLHNIHWSQISLSTIVNPLIMLIFIGLIIFEQYKRKEQ